MIAGHDHYYERSWPVYANASVGQKGYDDPSAPTYVVMGGGGKSLYSLSSSKPMWSSFRASGYQTLLVQVEGNRMGLNRPKQGCSRLLLTPGSQSGRPSLVVVAGVRDGTRGAAGRPGEAYGLPVPD